MFYQFWTKLHMVLVKCPLLNKYHLRYERTLSAWLWYHSCDNLFVYNSWIQIPMNSFLSDFWKERIHENLLVRARRKLFIIRTRKITHFIIIFFLVMGKQWYGSVTFTREPFFYKYIVSSPFCTHMLYIVCGLVSTNVSFLVSYAESIFVQEYDHNSRHK